MVGRSDERGTAAERAAQGLRADRLSRVLDEVQRLCAELDEMSRRQGAELDAGRAADAAAVVEERSRLVVRLGEAASELGPDAAAFERSLAGVPESLAARARDQASLIAAIVGEVLARDREDRALFEGERERLAEEMAGIGRGRSAIGAYGSGESPGPMMQDRRG